MPISLGFWEWGCPHHCYTGNHVPSLPLRNLVPKSPRSDKQHVSHNIISAQSTEKVRRVNEMITKWKNALIFYQILLTNSVRIWIEISRENLCADVGA